MSELFNALLKEETVIEILRDIKTNTFKSKRGDRWLVVQCLWANGTPAYQLSRPDQTGRAETKHEPIETIDQLVTDKKIRVIKGR